MLVLSRSAELIISFQSSNESFIQLSTFLKAFSYLKRWKFCEIFVLKSNDKQNFSIENVMKFSCFEFQNGTCIEWIAKLLLIHWQVLSASKEEGTLLRPIQTPWLLFLAWVFLNLAGYNNLWLSRSNCCRVT